MTYPRKFFLNLASNSISLVVEQDREQKVLDSFDPNEPAANEELKKYPKISGINESFINFINSSTLIGHNNDFIFNFLNKELNIQILNEKIDIFEIAKKKYPNENNSIDNLKKKLNIINNSTFSSSLNEVLELPKILDMLS